MDVHRKGDFINLRLLFHSMDPHRYLYNNVANDVALQDVLKLSMSVKNFFLL